MKTSLKMIWTTGLLIGLAGCSGDKVAGDIEVDWEDDQRSYKAIVKDNEGTPRVQLICQYVGKKPEEPVKETITRDWKANDTDFYHYKMVNLTDQPIELSNVSFRLKTGKNEEIYDTKGQGQIDKDWGGHIIPARGNLTRRNAFVWALGAENVLHKIYSAKSAGQEFDIDTQLVYQR